MKYIAMDIHISNGNSIRWRNTVPAWLTALLVIGFAFLGMRGLDRAPLIPYSPVIQAFIVASPLLLFLLQKSLRINKVGLALISILFLFFCWSLLTALFSEMTALSSFRVFIVALAVFSIIFLVCSDRNHISTLFFVLKCLSILGLFFSTYAITIYFFGAYHYSDVGHFQSISILGFDFSQRIYGVRYRVSSLFGNPNVFASLLVVTMLSSLVLARARLGSFWTSSLLIQCGALFLTLSRGAMAAFLMGLAFFYFLTENKKEKLFFSILIVVISTVAIFSVFSARYLLSEDIFTQRLLAWRALLDGFYENPLLGYGFGISYEAILERAGVEFGAHSLYLALLTEIGFIGFVLFFTVWIGFIFLGLFELKNRGGLEKLAISFSLALLVAMIFHQFFETNVMRFDFYSVMWGYAIALLARMSIRRNGFVDHRVVARSEV